MIMSCVRKAFFAAGEHKGGVGGGEVKVGKGGGGTGFLRFFEEEHAGSI